MRSTQDYIDLITSEHRVVHVGYDATRQAYIVKKTKFTDTIMSSIDPVAVDQSVLMAMQSLFDVDTAKGVNLDHVGEWVGVSRELAIPIPYPWFSFDDPLRGLDQAPWQELYDVGDYLTHIDDETYRRLIRAKIIANKGNGEVVTAIAALTEFLGDSRKLVIVTDDDNMHMTIGIPGELPSAVDVSVIGQMVLPLKPAGVGLSVYFTSFNHAPLFGFDVANEYVGGFDVGSFGVDYDYLINQIEFFAWRPPGSVFNDEGSTGASVSRSNALGRGRATVVFFGTANASANVAGLGTTGVSSASANVAATGKATSVGVGATSVSTSVAGRGTTGVAAGVAMATAIGETGEYTLVFNTI